MTISQRAAANKAVILNLNEEEYPSLYKLLYRRLGGLLDNLIYMLDTLPTKKFLQYEGYGAMSFSQAMSHFAIDEKARDINRNKKTWHYKLLLLTLIGLLKRNKPDKTSTNPIKMAAYKASKAKRSDNPRPKLEPISFWYFDIYTQKQLAYYDAWAKRWLDSGASFTNFTKETAISVFGEYRANGIYQDKRKITKISKMADTALERAIASIIKEKGYATCKEVFAMAGGLLFDWMDKKPDKDSKERARKRAAYKIKDEWAKRKREILATGGNQYARPNKADIEKYNITGKQWIIKPIEGN